MPGTCILVDHSLGRLQKGAAAQLVFEGPENPTILQSDAMPQGGRVRSGH